MRKYPALLSREPEEDSRGDKGALTERDFPEGRESLKKAYFVYPYAREDPASDPFRAFFYAGPGETAGAYPAKKKRRERH